MNHPTPRANGENAPLSHRGALESRLGIASGPPASTSPMWLAAQSNCGTFGPYGVP